MEFPSCITKLKRKCSTTTTKSESKILHIYNHYFLIPKNNTNHLNSIIVLTVFFNITIKHTRRLQSELRERVGRVCSATINMKAKQKRIKLLNYKLLVHIGKRQLLVNILKYKTL